MFVGLQKQAERSRRILALACCVGIWIAGGFGEHTTAQEAGKIDFERQVAPIFVKHCVKCHGPEKQEAGFRLDRRDEFLNGGDGGPVIVPQRPEESRLMQLVEGVDSDVVMPPDGNRLSEKQRLSLKQWIKAGADWPEKLTVLPGLTK